MDSEDKKVFIKPLGNFKSIDCENTFYYRSSEMDLNRRSGFPHVEV